MFVVDSQSTDQTCAIAESLGAKVVQFHYAGGWPKKRQWAMDTLRIGYDWILLLDADEVVTRELAAEIQDAIQRPEMAGYRIQLRMYFLGRLLRHCDAVGRNIAEIECSVQIALPANQSPDASAQQAQALADAGVDTVIFSLRTPYDAAIIEPLGKALEQVS